MMRRWGGSLGSWRARRYLVCALGIGLSAWLTISHAESDESRQIKDQLDKQVRRIQSLEVVSHLETKTDLTYEQIRSIPSFSNQILLPKEEDREAFKGRKRYRRILQPEVVEWIAPTDRFGLVPPQAADPKAPAYIQERQASLKKEYDRAIGEMKRQEARGIRTPKRDPKVLDSIERDVTRSFNGRSLWMRRPRSDKVDEYQVWPITARSNWFQASPYLSAVGLHVYDPGPGEKNVSEAQAIFQLAKRVRDAGYEAEPRTEVIDGSTCVILKGSLNTLFKPAIFQGDLSDRVWLDSDHGLAVRKRELARDGQVMERWENSGLREVDAGLWLPTLVTHQRFADDAPTDLKGKPVLVENIRVEKVEVNRVADDLFDMMPKAGDVIEDLRGNL
ncbi:hypothetical protein [Singulisphaera sp. PoT]|uniref:hypothetical protein n=1 Tax=Singulisphaera sp. PoT TaxID=3411797 RepID=UPI003BF47504